jgi:hypothetical protein
MNETKKKRGGGAVKHESVLASGAGISVSPKRNETDRDTLCVSSLFLVETTHCQSVYHSHCHRLPLPLCSARERTNRTKGTSERTRVLHSRVIPEVAVARFTWLTSVWRPKWGAQGGAVITSWDGTEYRQNDATREFTERGAWVSPWNEHLRHFSFQLCVDWYSSFVLMNIPHSRPKITSQVITPLNKTRLIEQNHLGLRFYQLISL